MSGRLVVFDMDGTLVNSSITIANAINYVRENLGFEPLDPEIILKKVNDHTINPAQTFYHAKKFEPIHERLFSEYYTKNHDKELVLYQGIIELLEEIKNRGDRLAVATNAYRNSTIESLSYLKIYNYFDVIVCFDDVPRGKPYPDMLEKILKELGHTREESLFIGDGPRDEMASKRAGMPYIMVDWGFSDHSDAVRSVDDLKKILLQEKK